MASSNYRTFAAPGKGGLGFDPRKTAVLFIEMQNEFTTDGGRLHDQVREMMEATGMLQKAVSLVASVRKAGVAIFHAPISFAEDSSDNPNRHLGILAGCDHDKLFVRDTWGAQICDAMRPAPEDVLVVGKHGLSAFPGTNLEAELTARGVETLALGGFMANCCVESTMRDACEKGFNVVTLTDCVATTSADGQRAAVEITYPFFSA
jgi:nicotinamidase-related amidase